ncbi:hypothetical protein D3C76_1359260 [compost metagenome]
MILQAHHRWGHHEQLLERHTLSLQAAAKAGGDKATEGKAHQRQGQTCMLCQQPGCCGLSIVHFTAAHVMAAGTGADAAVIETQGNVTGIAGSALQHRHHFVGHGPALHRVGVTQQHHAAWLGDIQVQGFQLADRAIDEYGGFADKQG